MRRASVWLTGQQVSRAQRRGRYLPESTAHPGKMLPALARQAIETFSRAGDLVIDPMCGIGTTLVEALHLGRDAFGVEYEPRWAVVAEANVALAAGSGARGEGVVVVGDCRHLLASVPPEAVGHAGLVLTSPPYGASTHGNLRHDGTRSQKFDFRYSDDRTNLAYQGRPVLLDGVEAMLRQAGRVIRADGHIVLTARPWRHAGSLIDFPGEVVRAAERAGLRLVERNVALLAGVRAGRLVSHASFFQMKQVRAARAKGAPQHVIAHEDVLVFGRQR